MESKSFSESDLLETPYAAPLGFTWGVIGLLFFLTKGEAEVRMWLPVILVCGGGFLYAISFGLFESINLIICLFRRLQGKNVLSQRQASILSLGCCAYVLAYYSVLTHFKQFPYLNLFDVERLVSERRALLLLVVPIVTCLTVAFSINLFIKKQRDSRAHDGASKDNQKMLVVFRAFFAASFVSCWC